MRRDAGRWILPRDIEGAFARAGISAILRPAVFLTLADSHGNEGRTFSENDDFARDGRILTLGVRPFKVTYKRGSITVDLPGYYPKGDGEGLHVGKDMSVVDRALRTLKEKIDSGRAP